jgi:hypothetical protein
MSDADEALSASHASDWAGRRKSAYLLGAAIDDPRAFARLTELLDDADTAVVEAAATELVSRGGREGLSRAAEAFAHGEDDSAGYWIGDAITSLRFEGFPVDDAIKDLIATADNSRAREAAEELADYLRVERR